MNRNDEKNLEELLNGPEWPVAYRPHPSEKFYREELLYHLQDAWAKMPPMVSIPDRL